MSTAVWVEQVDPHVIHPDNQAWWYSSLDVRADPTGDPPWVQLGGAKLLPHQARALAGVLLSAADWAEGTA